MKVNANQPIRQIEPDRAPAGASKLTATVGNCRINRPEDVMWVKQALHDLGRYQDRHERHGYIGRELHEAICCYQATAA